MPYRSQQPEYENTLNNLCTATNVVYHWRVSNPFVKYTWVDSSGKSQCSRVNCWFISQIICKHVLKCEISAMPLTDHCLITISLTLAQKTKTSGNICIFNNNLQLNDGFCKQVKALCQCFNKLDWGSLRKWEWSNMKKWEWFTDAYIGTTST